MSKDRVTSIFIYNDIQSSSYWYVAANWSNGVPDGGSDAVIGPVLIANAAGLPVVVGYGMGSDPAGDPLNAAVNSLAVLAGDFSFGGTLTIAASLSNRAQLLPVSGTPDAPVMGWFGSFIGVFGGTLTVGGSILNKEAPAGSGAADTVISLAPGGADGQTDGILEFNAGGSLTGHGILNLGGYGAANGLDGLFGAIVQGSGTFTNVDNTIQGSGNLGGGSLAITNARNGTIHANNILIDTGAGAFTNNGAVTGGLVTFKSGAVSNHGSMEFLNNGGLFIAAPEFTLTGRGSVTLNAGSQLSGFAGGEKLINVDNTIQGGGNFANLGHIAIDNQAQGVIDGNHGLGVDTLFIATGAYAFSNEGVVEATDNGGLTLSQIADLTNAGLFTAASGGTFVLSQDTLDNGDGEIWLQADGLMTFDSTSIGGGKILIDAGGTLEATTGSNTLQGAIRNAGTLEAVGSDLFDVLSPVKNTGLIESYGSLMKLEGKVTGGGDFLVDAGITTSYLIFEGAVSGGGTATIGSSSILEFTGKSDLDVVFEDTSFGTLLLDKWNRFTGTVGNFGATDHVTIGGLLYDAGMSVNFVSNGAGGGEVQVQDASSHVLAHVTFVGSYTDADFALTFDSNSFVTIVATH